MKTFDAMIKIGEAEHEVPDAVVALIEEMRAKIEEQGAKLAELSAEGDADEPMPAVDPEAEAASMDGKGKPKRRSLDALEARLAFLEGERKRERAEFGKAVSGRVSLLTTAHEVLGNVDGLDAHSDADIKRAVVIKVEPSMKPKLDGKSADFIDAAYEMAVSKHRERRTGDSSHQLLGLAGAAHLGQLGNTDGKGNGPVKPIDLNAVRTQAMDSLAHKTN